MSLTFRRVSHISKRRCQSESKSQQRNMNRLFDANQIDTDLDEFPPLQKSIQVANSSMYGTHFLSNTCSSGYQERFSNGVFLDSIANKCFEEDRWNIYQRRGSIRTYSQSLICSKLGCQKPTNMYCSKMDLTTMYQKSIGNILDGFKLKRSDTFPKTVSNNLPLNNNINQCVGYSSSQFNFGPCNAKIHREPNDFLKPKPGLFSSISHQTFEYPFIPPANTKKPVISRNIFTKLPEPGLKPVVAGQQNKISFESNFQKQSVVPRKETFKSNSSTTMNVSTFQSSCYVNNAIPNIRCSSEITEKPFKAEGKPIKARSIHTMNESIREGQLIQVQLPLSTNARISEPFSNQKMLQPPAQESSPFPNTSWYLQDNLSNQFGFSSILNGVAPVFQHGNFYAECYDFPTVPPDAFSTMMPVGTPVLAKKKDFKLMFSPYRRENSPVKSNREGCLNI